MLDADHQADGATVLCNLSCGDSGPTDGSEKIERYYDATRSKRVVTRRALIVAIVVANPGIAATTSWRRGPSSQLPSEVSTVAMALDLQRIRSLARLAGLSEISFNAESRLVSFSNSTGTVPSAGMCITPRALLAPAWPTHGRAKPSCFDVR